MDKPDERLFMLCQQLSMKRTFGNTRAHTHTRIHTQSQKKKKSFKKDGEASAKRFPQSDLDTRADVDD